MLISRKSLKGCALFVASEILYNFSKDKKNKEIFEADYDYRADIFSLGFTIYNLMEPLGNLRNLPEIIVDYRNYKRVKIERKKNEYYSAWLVEFMESLYNNDMEKRPTSDKALEKLNNYISIYNIDTNQKIHVTYLNFINNNFQTNILEFLNPSNDRKIKLITSMKCVLQVLYKLDEMKKIKKIINGYKVPETYENTLLNSFMNILVIIEKNEQNAISKDIYENNISKFINQTFKKNKSMISGIIPSNLYFMLLETFNAEILKNFNFLYNDSFDELYKFSKNPFSNLNLKITDENKLNNLIKDYKDNFKGPFANNFYFINFKFKQCQICKHIFPNASISQMISLDIRNKEENIKELIDRYMNFNLTEKKCKECKTITKFIEKSNFLNAPLYLVFELEDRNDVFFDDIINIKTFNEI